MQPTLTDKMDVELVWKRRNQTYGHFSRTNDEPAIFLGAMLSDIALSIPSARTLHSGSNTGPKDGTLD